MRQQHQFINASRDLDELTPVPLWLCDMAVRQMRYQWFYVVMTYVADDDID